MAKSSLKLNDEFVFQFFKENNTKKDFVKSYFLKNYNKIQLKDLVMTKNIEKIFPPYVSNNWDDEPHFMMEVELTFSGLNIGGILYKPQFNEESSLSIDLVDDNYEEDEKTFYLKFKVSGELFWDFKSNDMKKFKSHVEKKGSSWENSKLEVRLNIRNNPLYLNHLKFDDNGKQIPNGKEDENDIRFILESTGNIPSVIYNYSPEKQWEKDLKVWQLLSQHNVTFEGNYLKHFN